MKELARRLTQRVIQGIALKFGLNYLEGYLSDGKAQLTDLGTIYFQRLLERVKKGEKIPLSEHFGVLSGFKFSIDGLSLLENLKGKGALFLENHTIEGPISGDWKLFAASYFIKEMTGKEIRWISRQEESTPWEFFRNPIPESVNVILARGTKSANAIPVGEGDGTKGVYLILKAFSDQEIVGLFPEADVSKELIRGDSKAGGIILYAASKNIPIISTAAWFGKNTCHLSFTLLDNEFIKSLASKSSDRGKRKQEIVDYAMAVIAQNMPRWLRGDYKNFPVPTPVK